MSALGWNPSEPCVCPACASEYDPYEGCPCGEVPAFDPDDLAATIADERYAAAKEGDRW